MRAKASIFIATSLDGYIARKNGSLDWLDKANALVAPAEDCGFKSFFKSVDVLIMGRKTFETVLGFGDWPYSSKKVIVLSHSKINIPDDLPKSVSYSNHSPKVLVQNLTQEGFKHLYIDGGKTIQSFLQSDLIDEITITKIPVILGEGIPLFSSIGKDISLKLIHCQSYDFGYVQLKYQVLSENNL